MHVHELNPKKTLVTLVAFAILILVGFFTMRKPLLEYNLDMSQSIEMLNDPTVYFSPEQLTEIVNNPNDNVVLIDLRNNFVFGQGHIPGAENISAYQLTQKENIERLEEFKKQNITVVFYGDDQLQANGPWMVFRQLGFDNIKVLLGGYSYYKEAIANANDTLSGQGYIMEIPKFNYAEIFKNVKPDSQQEQSQKSEIKIVRRKKTKVVSGGC